MILKQEELTPEFVRDWLEYHPETGEFFLRRKTHSRDNTRNLSDALGYTDGRGYVHFSFFGRKYKAHRMAWFYTFGKWPAAAIDHINGDRTDNRLNNLREATILENSFNRHARTSKTGYRGVYEDKNNEGIVVGYYAQFNKEYLGYFSTPEAAAEVVNQTLIERGGVYANLNRI